MSKVEFSQEETSLLSKGFNYNLRTKDNVENRQYLGVECELALNNVPNSNIDKHIIAQTISSNKYDISHGQFSKEYAIVESIKNKTIENNIIFTRADKGNTVVALNQDDYFTKTFTFLDPAKFQKIHFDPTAVFQKLIKEVIRDLSIFDKHEKFKLTIMNPQTPKLYSLIKLHKDNMPIRPVVSYITAPSVKLSNKLIEIITKFCNFKPKFTIKNSYQLLDRIKDVDIPGNAKLISFDVQNLFPSIPPNEVLNLVEDLLIKNKTNPVIQQDIIVSLAACLDQNYFEFNNSIYVSKDGLIMGNPLSPLLAEIFMDNLESKIHQNALSKNCIYWYRYVDDIITCFVGTDRQLQSFFKYINSLHPNIKFTLETEQNNSINFLDLTITKVNNKHEFSIFHKPSHTDITIHNSSSHPYTHKVSAYNSFIHRLINIPLSEENYNKELNIIKQIAVNNGYQAKMIDDIITKKQYNKAIKLAYPCYPKNDSGFKTLTYNGKITHKVSKYLRKRNIRIAFKTNNKLGKLIKNNKTKNKKENKCGVYKLKCGSCPKIYIGQTGRSFDKRIKEHRNSYLKKHTDSHYALHLNNQQHTFDNNFEILHQENKSLKLNLLESMEINKYKKRDLLLNDQLDLNSSPLLNLNL